MTIEKVYLDSDRLLSSIIQQINRSSIQGELTLLVGAGISKNSPACLPLSREITEILCKLIAKRLNININDLLTSSSHFLGLEPFLRLIEVYCFGEKIEELIHIFDSTLPNINHYAIANLIKNNSNVKVICLNFDYLIELAFYYLYKEFITVSIPEGNSLSMIPTIKLNSYNHQAIGNIFIKPHGTLIQDKASKGIVASVQKLGYGMAYPMRELISKALRNNVLFVTGYSDNDIDIFPLISSVKPNKIIWNTIDDYLPNSVEYWLKSISSKATVLHLIGRCENIFSLITGPKLHPSFQKEKVDIETYLKKWINTISDIEVTSISAWIAQDRHRTETSNKLYLNALNDQKLLEDKYLERYIRYRYAALLRDQYNALKFSSIEYKKILFSAVKQMDMPTIVSTLRTISSLNLKNKKSPSFFQYLYSVTLLVITCLFQKMTSEKQWNNTRFSGEKYGIWIKWEFGMILLGISFKFKYIKILQKTSLLISLKIFKKAEKSTDLYESNSAIFSQARVYANLYLLTNKKKYISKAKKLLSHAEYNFKILDDVTGIKNVRVLRKMLEKEIPDPWFG